MRALLLPVRSDWYGLPLATVAEVLEATPVTRLPGAPPAVLGLVNVRGAIVPVLDTALLLGLPGLGLAGVGALAIVDSALGVVGLAGSDVPVAETLEDDLGVSQLEVGLRRYRAAAGPVTVVDVDAAVAAGVAA